MSKIYLITNKAMILIIIYILSIQVRNHISKPIACHGNKKKKKATKMWTMFDSLTKDMVWDEI